MSENILDLDAIAPIPKLIKINGKQYPCNPLTVKQVVQLVRLNASITGNTDINKVNDVIVEMIRPLVPDLVADGVDLTADQVKSIIQFAQDASTPSGESEGAIAAKEFPIKKKEDSPKE